MDPTAEPPGLHGIVIRDCQNVEEYSQCVALEKEAWGYTDAELVPMRVFLIASKIGGQVIGAFEGERLLGFVLAIPGLLGRKAYLHSHMLAVYPAYRDLGLGRRLKLAQRQDALRRGIERIEWTFDPLEIKNAYLNIEKLGAIVRRYSINHYGQSSSLLQGGLPTDRMIAEWWLRSERVRKKIDLGERATIRVEMRIDVPAAIRDWKRVAEYREKAEELQQNHRRLFRDAFERGLTVLGYERDRHGNGAFLLGLCDEDLAETS